MAGIPGKCATLAVCAALAASAATAAQVARGNTATRTATTWNQRQVAAVTLSSLSDATGAFAAGFSGIGEENPEDVANAIFAWLFMVPSLDCADRSREATVCLLTPEYELDIPDRAAVLPLSPIGGAMRLRDSLKAAYGKITGTNVLFCSESVDSNRFADVCMVITRDTAFVANNREALKWIARHYRDKTVPSVAPVRSPSPVSLTFDGPLSGAIISQIVPQGVDLPGYLGLLSLFGDILQSVTSLDVTLAPDIRSWRLACRLNYEKNLLPRIVQAPIPRESLMELFPPSSFCRSASTFPLLVSLLPSSMRTRYGGTSPVASFCGFHLLPCIPETDDAIYAALTGERASAYVIDPYENRLGKVEIFTVKNPEALDAAIGGGISKAAKERNTIIAPRPVRESNGVKIQGYAINVAANAEVDTTGDFVAKAISLLLGLNTVETAIAGDKLVVAAGAPGFIETWISKDMYKPQKRAIASLTTPFEKSPAGEVPLGGGEIQPSATLLAAASKIAGLHSIEMMLPHSGNGCHWQMSRCDSGMVFEFSASNSEILAIKTLSRLDTKELGQYIINVAMSGGESRKFREEK